MPARAGDVTGVLLAGGRSRRMFDSEGEGDKALLDVAGKPMIAHVAERLAPQVARLVLNANGDPARFAALRLPVAADTFQDYAGPLAGVLAGMRWAAATAPPSAWIATVSADAPFIPLDLVARLLAAGGDGHRIALASSAGALHPVIGLWPVALADDLDAALRSGLRKTREWTDRHGAVQAEFPLAEIGGAKVDPFFNVNTPEQLDAARALLQTSSR